MSPEILNQNTEPNFEHIKEELEPFKNAGISIQTFEDLKQKFLKDDLKPYQETYEQSKDPQVVIVNNDEKLLSNEEFDNFIDTTFQGDILRKGLITNIEIRFGEINYQASKDNLFGIEPGEYYIPKEHFSKIFNKLSLEQQTKLRTEIYHGESFAAWNRITDEKYILLTTALSGSGFVLPTPIAIFNLEFDAETKAIKEGKLEQAGLEYLEITPEEERLQIYALGTITHEVGHHLFQHLIYGKPQEKEWKEIVDRLGSITKYAAEYTENSFLNYDENFAEAMRLFTTTKEFLEKSEHSEMARFIEKYFPEIKS